MPENPVRSSMAFSFRKFSKRIIIFINVMTIVLFLLAGIIPYVNPLHFSWLGFAGLAFPYLLVLVAVFFVFWLITKPRYSLISLMAILLCWKQVGVTLRITKKPFDYRKTDQTFRVMTWNVKIFEGITKGSQASAEAKREIFSFIKATDPSVLCLQEFAQYDSSGLERDHLKKMAEYGYPYYFFSEDYSKASADYRSGVAIFSKTPILHQQRIQFTSNRESIIYVDVLNGTDTFRIFSTHLQSFHLNKNDYRNIDYLKNGMDVGKDESKYLLIKMNNAFRLRAQQAQQIKPLLDSCPYPEIICGDFNDVPNSYTYWHIRGDRRDAFMERGTGIGRTFISLAPTLRIDYILCDNRIKVDQFDVADRRWSDHLPLVADVRLEKK